MSRITRITPKMERNFWAKVEKSAKCWEWLGAKNKQGYGLMAVSRALLSAKELSKLRSSTHVKMMGATHVSWIVAGNKAVPKDKFLCHHCDNPSCVRPAHLFVGTHKDNHADMVMKGRNVPLPWVPGEANGASKIKVRDVRRIRRLASGKITMAEIGELVRLSKAQVHRILRHKAWRHI